MALKSDIEYFSRRVEEEREKAERAGEPATYRIHTEFARHYERKLRSLIAGQPVPQLKNGSGLH
ncbi:hypothetical protein J2W22_001253 [Sphingomonas kyeonggiensis]|uniref:hypothetical protein n=1 Tax=Sphingomonas kyeonggiensis TaxID=1268553 RepID=UPI00277DF5B3|nr:hypothetical protein [Sphingomonas kyeonggiensis]MDQ0249206.1 hypothetical protein [Sphingomonas kyeonggiensis]